MSPALCDDDDDDAAGDEIDLAAMLDGSRKKKKKKRATINIDRVGGGRGDTGGNFAEDASSSSSSSSCSGGDDDGIDSCCSSSDSTAESDESLLLPCHTDDDQYTAHVRSWVNQVPIGLGLCPWAMKSKRQGRLYYRTCQGSTPSDVAMLVLSEAKALLENGVAPLSTTLIVCPHVAAWNNNSNNNFQIFHDFVNTFLETSWKVEGEQLHQLSNKVTLVAFHPEFVRWRGLPEGITIGSVVQSYRDMGGFRKSQQLFTATVMETRNSVFGLRKIKVRFHDHADADADARKEQYVPVDWLVVPPQLESSTPLLLLLPDNAMHRAPYPTVHLIRNHDLGTLCIRDVSRVKRKNAQRMMELGWKGVLQKTAATATT